MNFYINMETLYFLLKTFLKSISFPSMDIKILKYPQKKNFPLASFQK